VITDPTDLSVLDPDQRAIVEAAAKAAPIWTVPPSEGRAMRASSRAALNQPREEIASVETRTIALEGRSIDVTIFTPKGAAVDRPGIFYIHGGGFVHGTVGNVDPTCRQLANRLDAVVVSSAWHWMDQEPAAMEVARVLGPNGVLGLLWNGADRTDEWVETLLGPGLPPADQDSEEAWIKRHKPELPDVAPFHDMECRAVRWSMRFTVDELVGLMGSYSRVFTLPAEGREKVLATVRDKATSHLALTGESTVELPMRCQCWRFTRD